MSYWKVSNTSIQYLYTVFDIGSAVLYLGQKKVCQHNERSSYFIQIQHVAYSWSWAVFSSCNWKQLERHFINHHKSCRYMTEEDVRWRLMTTAKEVTVIFTQIQRLCSLAHSRKCLTLSIPFLTVTMVTDYRLTPCNVGHLLKSNIRVKGATTEG